MSGGQWVAALLEDPALADQYKWEKLSGDDWRRLLKHLPQFADKCDWDMMNEKCSDWAYLLDAQPNLAKYLKTYK